MPWWIWIILGAVLFGAEMVIAADFYLVFFGASGLIVGLALLLGLAIPAWAQWLSYAAIAIASLVLYRKRLKEKLTKPDRELDAEIIDEIGVCDIDIAAGTDGRIELRGTLWSARNVGDRDLQSGDRVKVVDKKGLLLHVCSEH